MTEPRDELRSPELLSSTRSRLTAGAFVVLALAVVAIAALRPDRQGVGTPLAGASPSPSALAALPLPSPATSSSYLPPPVPPALVAKTGSRLVVVQGTKLEILDVDTGFGTPMQTDYRLVHHARLDVVSVGDQLVLLGDDQTGAGNGYGPAYATRSGPGSALHTIGEATGLSPSDRAGRVWLSHVEDDATPLTTLTEVDLQGRVYRHGQFVGSFGVEPFGGLFLRHTVTADKQEGEDVELVDASGARRRLYRHVTVLLVSGKTALLADRVACEKRCDLHVLTAGSSVTERVLHLGPTPDLVDGGLSPDGSRLFVGVRQESADPAPSIVSELSLATGRWRPVTGAWAATYYGASYRFSPDGRWMFFVDADERHVDAFDLAVRQAYRVKGDFAQITQLELLPP